ncbi:TaqI-like C-terminal specificity domain-containing protein [Riemerella anatipestifer]|nr:TaqI-like C-terminal specificity domain-containing protein [Riemerella anatipestifer]
MSVFISQNYVFSEFKTSESWVILSSIEKQIKDKIERIGKPLKDWDISINYGIKTGYNEAFIIDGKKKDELIAEDPKSAEIIRPILRGRDIKRYSYDFADLYLLYIPWHFPLHKDSEIKGASAEAEKAFENQYPAVYKHLLQYKNELSNRNKAETGIRYEWYALQRWGANYSDDFSKQKITYIEIMTDNPDVGYEFPCFSFDKKNCVALNTAYIITGNVDELKHILGILNSRLGRLLVKNYVVQLQQRQFRMLNQYVINFPIPKIKNSSKISILVDEILSAKEHLKDTKKLEQEIDSEVYNIFEFNVEEINFINNI